MKTIVLAFAVVCVGLVAPAEGQSGAVLQFRGPRAATARSAVLRGARGRLELATLTKVRRAASDLGVNVNTRAGRRAVAEELELDYVIAGRVRGARTEIQVFDADGARVAETEAPAPTTAAGRRGIEDAVERLLDTELGADEPEDAEEEEEEDEASEALTAARLEALENEAPPGQHDDETDQDDVPQTEGALLFPRVVALVGADARRRTVEVTLADGQTRNYRTASLYPEITMHLEVRPLNSSRAARGLYAQADVAVAVGLSTNQRDPADPANVAAVDTSAWRLFVQGGYMAPLAGDRLQLGVMVGLGVDKFMFGENVVMSSSSYSALRAGVAGSYAILGPRLQLRADFGYRHVFGAGELSEAFGTSMSGRAFDVGVAATGAMDVGFTYGVHLGFATYKLAFAGPAADAEATEGRDNAFRMGIALGWSFP